MTDPLEMAAYRGRVFEQHYVRPAILWMQFGRFILPIPKIWPPSPWRWPDNDLSLGQIDDWRIDHAMGVLNESNRESPP